MAGRVTSIEEVELLSGYESKSSEPSYWTQHIDNVVK